MQPSHERGIFLDDRRGCHGVNFFQFLRRDRDTGSVVVHNHRKQLVHFIDFFNAASALLKVRGSFSDFRECDFGLFEGRNYKELSGNPEYQNWIDSGGTMPFPGGESMNEMTARVMKGFYEAMDIADGLNAAFVVHGGTIMAVMSRIDGGDFYDYQIDNGECLRFNVMT